MERRRELERRRRRRAKRLKERRKELLQSLGKWPPPTPKLRR